MELDKELATGGRTTAELLDAVLALWSTLGSVALCVDADWERATAEEGEGERFIRRAPGDGELTLEVEG
jgi:hypothetical protein